MLLSLIAAADENGCIGKQNALPWRLRNDLKHFRECTQGKTVIMGRKTHESIGRVLPNRRNIIITRNATFSASGCDVVSSIEDAFALCALDDEVFVIGGAEIYAQTIEKAQKIYLTRVHAIITDGDAFFPSIDSSWKEASREEHQKDDENEYAYDFVKLERLSFNDGTRSLCECSPL
jgi:dihydrofolate reductase